MISVLIPTRNEEVNLPHCLASLQWCDDIVILDSGSTDRTVEIATDAGCRVIHRPFDNWAAHLNWAASQISFRHPWVYYCDADEVVPYDLREELLQIASNGREPNVAYRLRYKNFFMGRWIKHCGIYPVWVMRFFRPEKVRWERAVHQTAKIDGSEGRLRSHFHHFSFRKGISAWLDKHNSYSTEEAMESLRSLQNRSVPWRDLFRWGNPTARRIALKELSFRIPFRSQARFIYMYFVKLGFLDGLAGYHYCKLLAIYEYLITLKIRELQDSDGDP